MVGDVSEMHQEGAKAGSGRHVSHTSVRQSTGKRTPLTVDRLSGTRTTANTVRGGTWPLHDRLCGEPQQQPKVNAGLIGKA